MRRWELKLITIRGEGVAGLLGGNIGLLEACWLLLSAWLRAPGEVVFLVVLALRRQLGSLGYGG